MEGKLDTKLRKVRRVVWRYYKEHGRHDLPWRKTTNPYRILVSEIMLQQTQVARVLPKYRAFIRQFGTVHKLADAPLRTVLIAWSGLGYNRRAKKLHEAAQVIVEKHHGKMPRNYEELIALPGVGPYTAGAICAFAYNRAVPLIETNIRTVLLHCILINRKFVPDSELLQLTEVLCDKKKSREWYWALMDYGTHLKEQGIRTNTQSKHYTKQSKFEGSDRQLRGAILRILSHKGTHTRQTLARELDFDNTRVATQLVKLQQEGLVRKNRLQWFL